MKLDYHLTWMPLAVKPGAAPEDFT